jgi:hypothetical protein
MTLGCPLTSLKYLILHKILASATLFCSVANGTQNDWDAPFLDADPSITAFIAFFVDSFSPFTILFIHTLLPQHLKRVNLK